MKRVFLGTFVAAAFAVGLSAQTTPPQSQPMQEAKDAAKTVTVTGCLKAGETADSFILSDLKWSQDKAAAAVGTAGAVTPAVTATALNLVGSPTGTKLIDHVGHTIELTGTIIDKADKPMASATSPDSAARPQASLNVRNLKMIAATCPAK